MIYTMCCVVCRTGTNSITSYYDLRHWMMTQHDAHLHMHLRSVLFIYLHDGNCISMILILQAHDPATLFRIMCTTCSLSCTVMMRLPQCRKLTTTSDGVKEGTPCRHDTAIPYATIPYGTRTSTQYVGDGG